MPLLRRGTLTSPSHRSRDGRAPRPPRRPSSLNLTRMPVRAQEMRVSFALPIQLRPQGQLRLAQRSGPTLSGNRNLLDSVALRWSNAEVGACLRGRSSRGNASPSSVPTQARQAVPDHPALAPAGHKSFPIGRSCRSSFDFNPMRSFAPPRCSESLVKLSNSTVKY